LVSALLTALGACLPPAATRGAIRLVDDAGDSVVLAVPARRIASLIPVTTEVLFDIGAGASVVGRTTWCDQPAEASRVTSLGDGLEPNVEAIVAVNPDLVILYRSPRNAAAAERLRQLGFPTIQLRTDGLVDLHRATGLLGRATGREAEAGRVLGVMDSLLALLDRRKDPGLRPSVLVLAWDQPPMTVGRGSFLHEILERAGARNVFDDLESPSAPVSLEVIATRDPDLILTLEVAPAITARPEWQAVRAVRERHFLQVRGSEFMRPTPRAPEAVRQLARALDSLRAR
jgi:ABC-type Fe3+-hydroxamate transport system substrate-binding protein